MLIVMMTFLQVELPPADLSSPTSLTQTMSLLKDVLQCHDSSVVTIENKKQDFKQVGYESLPNSLLFNPLPDMPISGSSSSAANIDMMSKHGQMGIQLSDSVDNIVGKGEIARYEQILLFPQCFQKLSVADASKSISME